MPCYSLFATYRDPEEYHGRGKGKTSLYSPLGLQEDEASKISRQTVQKGGKVVTLSTGRIYPPGYTLCTHIC